MTRVPNESSKIGQVLTTVAVLAFSSLLSACASAGPGGGQEAVVVEQPEPVSAEPVVMTTIDGVYTSEQADRGEDLAQANCMACHSVGEWTNGRYIGLWQGRSVGDLFDNLEGTMPYDEPGRMTRQEYADVIAYMFSLSDLPTGNAPLPSDAEALERIQVVEPGDGSP